MIFGSQNSELEEVVVARQGHGKHVSAADTHTTIDYIVLSLRTLLDEGTVNTFPQNGTNMQQYRTTGSGVFCEIQTKAIRWEPEAAAEHGLRHNLLHKPA
jgi:hypothetical protein